MTNKIVKLYHNGEEYYIDEYQEGWKPGANTIAYYKLDGDIKDYSGNNRDLTGSGVTYTSGGPGQVGVFSGGATAYYQNNSLFNISYPFTYSLYVQTTQVPTGMLNSSIPYHTSALMVQDGTDINSFDKGCGFGKGGFLGYNYYNNLYFVTGGTAQINTWYHIVYTFDGSKQKIYSNGTLVGENNCLESTSSYSNARLVISFQRNTNESIAFNGKISNVIIENKARTAQEIADYYNQTKSLYGIN